MAKRMYEHDGNILKNVRFNTIIEKESIRDLKRKVEKLIHQNKEILLKLDKLLEGKENEKDLL